VRFADKVLIGQRSRYKKVDPLCWEFIQGYVEEKEPAEQTILRELKEEVNLEGLITRTADPFVLTSGDSRWIVVPFLIDASSAQAVRNDKDHEELRWILPHETDLFPDLEGEARCLRERGLL
jgi:8-oxo-dGTP pyrophosphatase MutT (NUDIX family)